MKFNFQNKTQPLNLDLAETGVLLFHLSTESEAMDHTFGELKLLKLDQRTTSDLEFKSILTYDLKIDYYHILNLCTLNSKFIFENGYQYDFIFLYKINKAFNVNDKEISKTLLFICLYCS